MALLAGLVLLTGCPSSKPLPPPELSPAPPSSRKPPAPEAPDPGRAGVVHVVERGQTTWRIARAYGLSVEELAEANDLEDPTEIEVGQRLFIPGAARALEVEPYRPERTGEQEALASRNRGDYIWPVKGRLVSRFGMRGGRRHTGIDIAAPAGTPVRAARAGEVSYAGSGYRGYGNLVILDHGDGFRTYYAHNRKILVKRGEKVRRGQTIAKVGSTGRSSGPHLHFEIREGSRVLDPLPRLP
jgi:murein DD-endopeptidase MepM/ murein hydrolase activator NlpD